MAELSPVALALLSGGVALAGVAMKAALDAVESRRRNRRDDVLRFEALRSDLIAQFLSEFRRCVEHAVHLHRMATEIAQNPDADPAKPEDMDAMRDLVTTLERLRVTARTLEVIRAAERLVMSLGILGENSESTLLNGAPRHDDMRWYIAHRVTRELERCFIHAARAELRLGPPEGAPDEYPLEPIPEAALKLIREHRPDLFIAPSRGRRGARSNPRSAA